MTPPAPMLLNLQMIADPMDELLWDYTAHSSGETPCFRGCQIYCGQPTLSQSTLYLLPQGAEDTFPVDVFSYITTTDLSGKAPHIRNVRHSFEELLNLVLTTFQRYHDFELALNGVITSGGDLEEICQISSEFFHNPVYIHDDMFSVIAASTHVEGMLEFEQNKDSGEVHIPLWLINEFKFDKSYLHTLELHQAGLWGNDQFPFNMRSLFVNLWDGERYRGRVLINEIGSSLQPGQFRAAEYVAEYITTLLRHLEQRQDRAYHNFKQTLIALITGEAVNEQDLRNMLYILDWSQTDQYLCIKLRPQDPGNSIRSDSALDSTLAAQLQGCVSLYHQKQLCIVLNLSRSNLNIHAVRQILAPHIRDSYMHAGISSPVYGIQSLGKGFLQADIALHYISQQKGSDWILSFSSCALPYILERSCSDLPADLLAHPALRELKDYDKKFGTQYYETLGNYLYCERDIPLTSARLIIHRTTLSYRLRKIQELTRLDLEDEDLRLYLLISFHLMADYK